MYVNVWHMQTYQNHLSKDALNPDLCFICSKRTGIQSGVKAKRPVYQQRIVKMNFLKTEFETSRAELQLPMQYSAR